MLLVALAVSWAALLVVARLGTARLSGTAAVTITATSVTGGSAFEQAPSGTWLIYTYSVGGATYNGKDFRRWIDVNAHEPKVCFDPSSPADHLLVEGSYECGSGR